MIDKIFYYTGMTFWIAVALVNLFLLIYVVKGLYRNLKGYWK